MYNNGQLAKCCITRVFGNTHFATIRTTCRANLIFPIQINGCWISQVIDNYRRIKVISRSSTNNLRASFIFNISIQCYCITNVTKAVRSVRF
nr:hypothetical protein 1048p_00013 [Serratia proteamaculans]